MSETFKDSEKTSYRIMRSEWLSSVARFQTKKTTLLLEKTLDSFKFHKRMRNTSIKWWIWDKNNQSFLNPLLCYTASSLNASFLAPKREWLVTKSKEPWEGGRREEPVSRLPFISREKRLRTRQQSTTLSTELQGSIARFMCDTHPLYWQLCYAAMDARGFSFLPNSWWFARSRDSEATLGARDFSCARFRFRSSL